MEPLLIIPILLAFISTLFVIPYWIKKAEKAGLVWKDMHKKEGTKKVVGSGGIGILVGFTLGVLTYIALKTFVLKTDVTTVEIFALLVTILISGIIGLMDDFLGWVQGGLSAKLRIFLLFIAAIPLVVINVGESTMMGIEFGLFYPLLLIPIGIVGASASFNFLAGYNGLEASQGIIILSALSLVTWLNDNSWLSLISLIMVACLIIFYMFNKYPAKIFPGDVLTYPIGALIAIITILGNIEKIAIFFFIPYILETCLKVRGRLKKYSFAKVNSDESLEIPYEKFYGLEHIAVYLLKKIKKNGKVYEKDVVYLINLFQILIIVLGFLLFGKGL